MNRSLFVMLVLGALGFAACAPHKGTGTNTTSDADSQTVADDGSDTAAAENDQQTLTSTLVATSGANVGLATEPVGGDLSLDNIGDGAKLFFRPAGCLAVTSDTTAMKVTYEFGALGGAGCVGPRGLNLVKGTVDVTYSMSNGVLSLALTATGLEVNKATIDWNATAVISATSASGRSMHWTGAINGTTRGGRAIERMNDKTVTWTLGDSCFTIEGTSSGNVTGRDLTTTLKNFSRCKDACPGTGSEVDVTRTLVDGTTRTVTLVFGADATGKADATFTDARGDEITFTPLCALL